LSHFGSPSPCARLIDFAVNSIRLVILLLRFKLHAKDLLNLLCTEPLKKALALSRLNGVQMHGLQSFLCGWRGGRPGIAIYICLDLHAGLSDCVHGVDVGCSWMSHRKRTLLGEGYQTRVDGVLGQLGCCASISFCEVLGQNEDPSP